MPDIDGDEVRDLRSDYYVYAYYYPGSTDPFYIGKGRGGRAKAHLAACKRQRTTSLFYSVLRPLLARGVTPEIRILHDGLTDTEAKDLEIELIEQWGRIDLQTGCLTNQTRGGDGVGQLAEGVRERVKATLNAQRMAPEYRERQSQAMTAYCRDPGVRQARSRRMKTRWDSEFGRNMRRAVETFNPITGATIKQYESGKAAVADGFSSPGVSQACRGQRKRHRGMCWRYSPLPQ